MTEGIALAIVLAVLFPFVAYLTAKLVAYGALKGIELYHRERSFDDGDDEKGTGTSGTEEKLGP